jgi:predicted small integral membrane protein
MTPEVNNILLGVLIPLGGTAVYKAIRAEATVEQHTKDIQDIKRDVKEIYKFLLGEREE